MMFTPLIPLDVKLFSNTVICEYLPPMTLIFSILPSLFGSISKITPSGLTVSTALFIVTLDTLSTIAISARELLPNLGELSVIFFLFDK